ncbi:hypothetical protein JTB14_003052 [Gonioctena quinquepunctata]|nr:hypothetical protein JTB14_003052 [Gonioctena quinquepunctata]
MVIQYLHVLSIQGHIWNSVKTINSALTPAHFLVGDSMIAVPQRDVTELPTNRLKLFQRLQQLTQHFWKRWSLEYITSLQQRSKWKAKIPESVRTNSLVLLREENLPPMQWRLGRIVAVHPGRDNVVRVVSVLTKNGVVKRSVTKVSALPID